MAVAPAVEVQDFVVAKEPGEALEAAVAYLEAAGRVAPPLAGRLQRRGPRLVVHHGRLKTLIEARRDTSGGTRMEVRRAGRAPLEDSRRWLLALGLLGTVVAWGLSIFNGRPAGGFSPVVTLAIFVVALVGVVAVLYVVDRSVEGRVAGLLLALEEAVAGDPLTVLGREMRLLARHQALVWALLSYCVLLVMASVVFLVLLSDGIRQGIDAALTVAVMRQGFLLPVVPAVLAGLGTWMVVHRRQGRRLAALQARPHARPGRFQAQAP